jgi:hypothetical protein
MTDSLELRALEVDLAANTLRLVLGPESQTGTREHETATIDIGAGGRLVGVELAGDYIDVMAPEPGTDHLIRSADVRIDVEREQGSGAIIALVVPRHGDGYEVTYPSGNQ